ncbi:ABC transporter permease [Myxococcota bacterium]
MVRILMISWRSIWRNRRRTLLNMSAVGFGLVLLLLSIGMVESYMNEAQNDLGNTGMGHIEIYAQGYRIKKDVRKTIAEPDALVAKLAARSPEGSRLGWRVVVQGLISTAWGSRGARIYGVDPSMESQLSKFFTDISAGETLQPNDTRGILLGEELAKRLKLKVKSKVRVMAQRADGEIGAELFRVRGIFHALSPTASNNQVFVVAAAAQQLLGIGDVAHQVIAQLPRAPLAEPLAADLRTELGDNLEVMSFGQLMPTLKLFQDYVDRFFFFMIFGIYFLVGLGVLNTMLMSVMERTREFGVMMAVGTRPRRLVGAILGEAFWIATISVFVGLVIGGTLTWATAEYGLIDWRGVIGKEAMDFGGSMISLLVRPQLSMGRAIQVSLIVWVLTLLFGMYPAWRVTRMQPADALRAG